MVTGVNCDGDSPQSDAHHFVRFVRLTVLNMKMAYVVIVFWFVTPCILAELCQGCGPDSLVGIATGYGLDGPGIESR